MNKEFPIEAGTPVLVKDEIDDTWIIEAFECIGNLEELPFRCSKSAWALMAPYDGNRDAIMTDKDVFDLWDFDRLKEEGFIK